VFVSLAASSPFGDYDALTLFGEVADHLSGVKIKHDRAPGDLDDDRFTITAMFLTSFAVAAVFSLKKLFKTERVESPAAGGCL
jgi:hypothetical protein